MTALGGSGKVASIVLLAWIVTNAPGVVETIRRLESEPDPMSDAPVVEGFRPMLGELTDLDFFIEESRLRDVRRRYYAAQYALVPVALRGPWVGRDGFAHAASRARRPEAALCYCATEEFRRSFEADMRSTFGGDDATLEWRAEGRWLAVRRRAAR